MAKAWSEVEASPEYKALTPEAQSKAKTQYFDTVVASKPEYAALDETKKAAARSQFLGELAGETAPAAPAPAKRELPLPPNAEKIQAFIDGQKERMIAEQNQATQQQIAAMRDADPRTWSSSRFKKEFPKPRTSEEQAIYDVLLEEKTGKEKALADNLRTTIATARAIFDPVGTAARGAAEAGVEPGKKIGEGYMNVRGKIQKAAGDALPDNPAMDTEFPIYVPNPLIPVMPIKAGTSTPRKATEELVGMGVDEIATAGVGGLAKLGIKTATHMAGQAPKLVEVLPKIVRTGMMKGVKPSTAGMRSAADIEKYMDEASRAIGAIYDNKKNLGFVDEMGDTVEKLPESVAEFSQAIGTTKQRLFDKYNALAKQAGREGAKIELGKIGDDILQNLTKSEKVLETISPESLAYVKTRAAALKKAGSFSAEEAQDAVQILNKSLEAFYKNPAYDTASRAVVDAGIANAIRRNLDEVIESATGSQYQVLRNMYKSLKTIERDVTKRALAEGRKNVKGLVDFSDIFSGSEIVRGLVHLDPGSMAAGATAKGISAYIKHVNNPNEAIKTMFRNYDKVFKLAMKRGRP